MVSTKQKTLGISIFYVAKQTAWKYRPTDSENQKTLGSIEAGGYVWHTTGSGKTLTSFKTAQLACKIPSIEKVLFVVDRKDIDYQTMKEYDRFEKGSANSNVSTNANNKKSFGAAKNINQNEILQAGS